VTQPAVHAGDSDFPRHSLAVAREHAIAEIPAEQLPDRRLRTNPRAIKRKMSGWGVERPDHRKWPQPTRPQDDALIHPRS
jgi:hypothetical protein